MKRILNQNWQFLLLSQIRRGTWLVDPSVPDSYDDLVRKIMEDGTIPAFDRLAEDIPLMASSGSAISFSSLSEVDEECICVIPMRGTLFQYGNWCHYGADEYAAMMDEARNHKLVKGVVIDMDSGGGIVQAVPPLIQAIEALRAVGKPVVASVERLGSAALWVASACDRIYAKNTISSMIGSIGTYCTLIDTRDRDEQSGMVSHEIYATKSTDKNRGYREAIDGKYEYIRTHDLDPITDRFIDSVKRNRSGKLDESAEGLFSGAMFYAEEAEKTGLIDGVKTLEEAIGIASDLATINSFTNQ